MSKGSNFQDYCHLILGRQRASVKEPKEDKEEMVMSLGGERCLWWGTGHSPQGARSTSPPPTHPYTNPPFLPPFPLTHPYTTIRPIVRYAPSMPPGASGLSD